MLHAVCGAVLACGLSGQPAEVVASVVQPPPQVVEVQQRVVVIRHQPRVVVHHHRRVVRNPPHYFREGDGCQVYNCIGPKTDFRLPHELPYSEYQRQFSRHRSGR